MNRSEVVCRNSPGYYEKSFALEMAATCKRISGFNFRIYSCRCCTKWHLTARRERVKA